MAFVTAAIVAVTLVLLVVDLVRHRPREGERRRRSDHHSAPFELYTGPIRLRAEVPRRGHQAQAEGRHEIERRLRSSGR